MELNRVEGRFVRRNLDGDGGTTLPRGAGAAEKKLQPRQLRPFTRKRVAEAMPAIMDRFVKEATNGSVAHTKVLVSLGGLDKQPPPAAKRRGRDVVRQLLEDLDRQKQQNETEPS